MDMVNCRRITFAMTQAHVAVVGAGMGGLAAAIRLAAGGARVSVFERSPSVGGKLAAADVAGVPVAAGPTVLTMRWVFDELFASAGTALEHHVKLRPMGVLARHGFRDGTRFDLHSDPAESRDAIGRAFGAAEARAFDAFLNDTRRIYELVHGPFIKSAAPSALDVAVRLGQAGPTALVAVDAFRTMWKAIASRFREPRLRHVFARYATYCGASPFEAPATFNVVSYVEALGVHRVDGGMAALGSALRGVARDLGVVIHAGHEVEGIATVGGRASGVIVDGVEWAADAVVWNGDVSALAEVTGGRAAKPTPEKDRSLSALTWMIVGRAEGVPLVHHNVFFPDDYPAEFADLFSRGRAPETPAVYVCAEDRDDRAVSPGEERFLVIVNAPASGDRPELWSDEEVLRCERAMQRTLNEAGVSLHARALTRATPVDFAARFPATGGAIYGARPKGAMSPLLRPGSRTRIPGLYTAGGSVHPGPGVPMAALSGRFAADAVLSDYRSTHRSRPVAISGTTSTP